MDPKLFREALGSYPTGVTVVTTVDGNGDPRGFTANSFTSVSLNPPLVLVCLAKAAHSHDVFATTEAFSIHVLSDKQKDTSGLFASKAADKFAKVAWSMSPLNTPAIHDSLATFHCNSSQVVDAGDHIVLIGEVKSYSTEPGRPLGYCRGAYVGYQDASVIDNAVRDGARVSALIETPQGVVLTRDANDKLQLPSSNRLGTPQGDTGLYKLLQSLGIKATLDFVYSVFEDVNGPCVIYRGRSSQTDGMSSAVEQASMANLQSVSAVDEATTSVLKRYAKERTEDLYGVYVGDANEGTVVPLKIA